VHERLGRPEQAIAQLEEGLALSRELGGPFSQVECATPPRRRPAAVGEDRQAEAAWREAPDDL
jgi:hypothetical protein